MNAMQWVEQTMTAEQTRLDTAAGNLANAHVRGYAPQAFSALIDDNGLRVTVGPANPNAPSAVDANTKTNAGAKNGSELPEQNSATVMIEVLQAQRDFETAQKIAVSIDSVRAKESGEMARSAT